jgi:hypothetical protein
MTDSNQKLDLVVCPHCGTTFTKEYILQHTLTQTAAQEEVATQNATPIVTQEEVATQNATPIVTQEEVATQNATPTAPHEEVATQNATPTAPHEEVTTQNATPTVTQEEVAIQNVAPTAPHEEVTIQNYAVFAVSFIAFILVAIVLVKIFSRNKDRQTEKISPEILDVDVGSPDNSRKVIKSDGSAFDLPLGMYPSEWFEKTDDEKLTSYTKQTQKNVKDILFDNNVTDITKAEQLQKVTTGIARELNKRLTSTALFEILNGGKTVVPEEQQFLKSHLDSLLPKLKLPSPIGEIGVKTVAIIAGIGALLGWIIGGLLVGYIGNTSAETGHLVGTITGAFLSVMISMFIVNNPRIRKLAMWVITTVVIVDTVKQIIKGIFQPSFVPSFLNNLFGNRKTTYRKRVVIYVALLSILFFLKRQYNRDLFCKYVDDAVEQYIRSALPIIVVLMFRYDNNIKNNVPTTGNDKLVLTCVPIIQRSMLQNKDDVEELIQQFKIQGFDFETSANFNEILVWSKELEMQYETFGYIPYGTSVCVQNKPTTQNGEVIKKGQVIKKK